jgi:NNP family nitrate/nitrite transporter-like MFS transporter
MFAGMAGFTGLALVGVEGRRFGLFLGAFLLVFLCTGMGNGAVYKLIPAAFAGRVAVHDGADDRSSAVGLEQKRRAAAALGIVGAFGALGGVGVQVVLRQAALGVSSLEKAAPTLAAQERIAAAHSAWSAPALWAFLVSYLILGALTWAVYLRRPASSLVVAVTR